jgi:hypothetical protein
LRPAAFFWAVVPPCFELDRVLELDELDFLPPRLEAPGEFAIFAARSFDMPFFFSPSYCFSFFTLGRLFGTFAPFRSCVFAFAQVCSRAHVYQTEVACETDPRRKGHA